MTNAFMQNIGDFIRRNPQVMLGLGAGLLENRSVAGGLRGALQGLESQTWMQEQADRQAQRARAEQARVAMTSPKQPTPVGSAIPWSPGQGFAQGMTPGQAATAAQGQSLDGVAPAPVLDGALSPQAAPGKSPLEEMGYSPTTAKLMGALDDETFTKTVLNDQFARETEKAKREEAARGWDEFKREEGDQIVTYRKYGDGRVEKMATAPRWSPKDKADQGPNATQVAANAEIDAARKALKGIDRQRLMQMIRPTVPVKNTILGEISNQPNPEYDPAVAEAWKRATQRKVGVDDPEFESFTTIMAPGASAETPAPTPPPSPQPAPAESAPPKFGEVYKLPNGTVVRPVPTFKQRDENKIDRSQLRTGEVYQLPDGTLYRFNGTELEEIDGAPQS
jgi:hypothetical protein